MKKNYLHLIQRLSLLLLWVCLFLSQATWAQSIPDAQWARVGSTLAITTDGNIVTSANLLGTGIPLTTPVGLKKYDLQGNQVWQAGPLAGVSYIAGKLPPGFCPCVGGVSVIDRILRIDPAPDGGIHLLGNEWGGAGVRTSIDATGRQAGSNPSGGGFPLLATPDGGGLYTGSFVEDLGNGQARIGLSVTKTGNPSWTTKFPFLGAVQLSLVEANVAINTPDGGYLLAGLHRSGTNDTRWGWVAKLDGQGNVSWQKLIAVPTPGPSDFSPLFITDATLLTDGTGYALVGQGKSQFNNNATGLAEIDLNGNVKPGRVKAIDLLQATNAYITTYTGSGGKKYYAVGNTVQSGRLDPQIRLVDQNDLSVVASRTFPGPGQSKLIDIATAGDGSLVFVTDNNQLVKLKPEATTQPPVGPLTLTAPTYNCATGAFTFNTSGGNGSTIEYMAPGITGWTTNPNQFVDEGSRTALDVQPFTLMARQNGVTVTYVWDLRAFCNGGPPQPPQPPVSSLTLTAPTYNCTTGAFTFNTSGGNGSIIEYMAPGITGWTTNPNQFVDEGSRTANDVQPFTLMARQNGVTVTLVWNLKAACGRARIAALPEPGTGLQVRVLGNPVLNHTAEVDITGAEHQALQLNLVDLQGRVLHQQRIEQAETMQRVRVPVGAGSGVLLLNVSTSTQRQQVKLIKP